MDDSVLLINVSEHDQTQQTHRYCDEEQDGPRLVQGQSLSVGSKAAKDCLIVCGNKSTKVQYLQEQSLARTEYDAMPAAEMKADERQPTLDQMNFAALNSS